MKKNLSYLLILSLLIIFVSACSDDDTDIIKGSTESAYLVVQLRADAGNNQVTLDWQMLPSAKTYNIYYIEDDGDGVKPTSEEIKNKGIKIDGETENILSAPYPVTGLKNGTIYWFALSADSGEMESNLTQAIYATPKDDPPLKAPENVRANAGDEQVTVTWDAVTGAAGYKAYYYTSFTMYGEGEKTTSDSYTFTGLTNDQTYVFFVVAFDSDDNSASGDSSASFAYTATPSENYPPSAPTNPVVIDEGGGDITVVWDTMPNAISYKIYIATAKGVTKNTGLATSYDDPDATATQAVGTTLTNGTYYIVVTAINANGESAESREVFIPITDNP